MMSEMERQERPEVYAIQQDGKKWQISRRDFLKAAGIGAAAVSAGLNSRLVRPASAEESMEDLCKAAIAHEAEIKGLALSGDGKYLVTWDKTKAIKCWDFGNYALLGTSTADQGDYRTAGSIDEKSFVYLMFNTKSELDLYELPEMSSSSKKKLELVSLGTNSVHEITAARNGVLYMRTLDQSTSNNKTRSVMRGKPNYSSKKLENSKFLYTTGEEFVAFAVFDNERKLLLKMANMDLRIVDLTGETPEVTDIDAKSSSCGFSIVPGDAAVLYVQGQSYEPAEAICLLSLVDGSEIWKQAMPAAGFSSPVFINSAVTPDGSMGILFGYDDDRERIWLISMADGSLIRAVDLGESSGNCDSIAVARDGSKLAVASKKTVFFVSLPYLEIIGCPVDIKELDANSQGIKVESTDPVTGKTVTITLPCGAAIPAGAVCTCNCVSGCSCVGNTCSCVGNTCSCQSYKSGGSHYWHPN